MGREKQGVAEDLRRLGAPELGARYGLGHGIALDPLQRVGERHAENDAIDPGLVQGLQAGGNVVPADKGARSVVDGDKVWGLAGESLQPVQDRMLPTDA